MKGIKKYLLPAVFTLAFISTAGFICADPYFIYGKVFNADGTSGTASDANSNCGLTAYRAGIPGQISRQNSGPDTVYPNKIYPAFYNSANTPAYFYSDAGSSDWTTAPAAGQEIVAVVQVYAPQFGWGGGAYVACTAAVITAANTIASETDFQDSTLEQIPRPALITVNNNNADIGWTGMDNGLISGYTVYRSTEPGGAGGYGVIGTAPQSRDMAVIYTDTGLSESYTYYYKIAVNFLWGGGNGAPDYYTTDAQSDASLGIFTVVSPTPTWSSTASPTFSASPTATQTSSLTLTLTLTETDTPTATPTTTPTSTNTVTNTQTFTYTITPTLTPTYSTTCTSTATPISALAANLAKEKMAIFNDPIKDGTLSIGIYTEKNGTAFIYVYDITGGLVRKTSFAVSAGANTYSEAFKKAPGIYILRSVIKHDGNTQELPLRKFAVIR